MASATTLLVWGLLEWTDAYRHTGQLGHMRDCIKWPLDYFIKAHSSNKELYVQVRGSNCKYKSLPKHRRVIAMQKGITEILISNSIHIFEQHCIHSKYLVPGRITIGLCSRPPVNMAPAKIGLLLDILKLTASTLTVSPSLN